LVVSNLYVFKSVLLTQLQDYPRSESTP